MNTGDSDNEKGRDRHAPKGPSDVNVGSFGMYLFIGSLTMLFGASMIGYLIIRFQAEQWPPAGMPEPPNTLWLSTAVLLLSSFTMHWALSSIKRGKRAGLKAGILVSALLGLAFLGLQSYNWIEMSHLQVTPTSDLYGFTFYVLTGIHALHVIGGIIPLGVVTSRAFQNRYSQEDHPGVRYTAIYWHFLDVVWIVMFVLIFLI